MTQLSIGNPAPDFSLPDYTGKPHTLSEANKQHNLLLVFNIGFA